MREAEPFYPVGNRNRVKFPQPPVPGPLAPSDYPVRDGNPMAETPIHWHATYDAAIPLHRFFKSRSDVYVGSDMFMYYREGDVNGNVVPDVWVAFGVPKLPERGTGAEVGRKMNFRERLIAAWPARHTFPPVILPQQFRARPRSGRQKEPEHPNRWPIAPGEVLWNLAGIPAESTNRL